MSAKPFLSKQMRAELETQAQQAEEMSAQYARQAQRLRRLLRADAALAKDHRP